MTSVSSPSIVYIMGRGHSGSTVLDAILGNAENAVGVGELIAGIDGSYPCSCGKDVSRCPRWARVRRHLEHNGRLDWNSAIHAIQRQAHVGAFPATLVGSRDPRVYRATQDVYASIASVCEANVVVESSKEISRALFLARHVPQARIIHIVRHPEKMLASNLHRLRDGSGFAFLRRTFHSERLAPLILGMSALSWVVGNSLCEVVRSIAPEKVYRLRYETLCASPATELRRIAAFTGLDLDAVISAIQRRESLSIDCRLAGNRMAQKGSFVFDPDRSSGRPIPPSLRKIGRTIAYPMMKYYGYA